MRAFQETELSYSQARSHHSIGHITDSRFFGDGFATPEARTIFSDTTRLQRWLDVEVALAEAQADLGMIPAKAAKTLAVTADLEAFDLDAVAQDMKLTGHSLVPLLRAWQTLCGPEAAQYLHFGATTQDIQDTAQSLEIVHALDLIERALVDVAVELRRLAKENRDVVAIARTHGQHALPTTIGLKFAVWLDETLRNLERLRACRKTVGVAQLFGGVGTMAAFGHHGETLLENFARRLGLHAPSTAWHTSRDRVVEFLSVLALVSGGLANVANEIVQLSKSDIGELKEGFQKGAVGSSTMPHKSNPENSERIVLLARLVKSAATLGFDALCNEHERDYRSVRLEWVAITDCVLHTAAALSLMTQVLNGLVVNRERIAQNVNGAAQSICSEALMFFLGSRLGKDNAYHVVYKASFSDPSSERSLVDRLMDDPLVAETFERTALAAAVCPENYVGDAGRIVDKVTGHAQRALNLKI